MPGSYLIEVGRNDIIYAPADEQGKNPPVEIQYDQPEKPGDAFTKGYSTRLFENEEILVTANYSAHKQFDGKLLSVTVFRKTVA